MTAKLQYPHWPEALAQARRGNLQPAEAGRAIDATGGLADGLFGRCLAEAGQRLDEAIALLRQSMQTDPGNPLLPHALALALARRSAPGDRAQACELWQRHHLPHDLDLLGQTALTLEAQGMPLPMSDAPPLPWPAALPKPQPPAPPDGEDGELESTGASAGPAPQGEGDNLSPDASKTDARAGGKPQPRKLAGVFKKLEQMLEQHQALQALTLAEEALASQSENDDLHLFAGAAASALGLWDRARAHLGRCLEIEPEQIHARLMLGRVYWRLDWTDLALAVWRSLPVLGPSDFGRYYHLALAHNALGDRAAAADAMQTALGSFFFDTRHAFIQQAWEVWQKGLDPPAPTGL